MKTQFYVLKDMYLANGGFNTSLLRFLSSFHISWFPLTLFFCVNKKILGDTGASETQGTYGEWTKQNEKNEVQSTLYILLWHYLPSSIQAYWTTWNSPHIPYSFMQSVSCVKNVLHSSFLSTLAISNSYSSCKQSPNFSLDPFTAML